MKVQIDFSSWKCADRRYYIRLKDTSNYPQSTYTTSCLWSKQLSIKPEDLECVLKFCDNATEYPNTPHNYNFNWNGAVIPLNTFVNYPCKNGHSLEQSVDWKHLAATVTQVKCNTTGLLEYPNPWPQCSTTVNCPDPGNSEGITRTQTDADIRAELSYASTFRYVCDDPRKWIKLSTQPLNQLAAFKQSKCLWRKTFQVNGNDLVCVIHHCQHPHDPDVLTHSQPCHQPHSPSLIHQGH